MLYKTLRKFADHAKSKPWLLDLFCGDGGAGKGYADAGFFVVGVDIAPHKHYPYVFIQADALEFGKRFGGWFDVIHASPPCQSYSHMTNPKGYKKDHPALIEPTRELLDGLGKPYVIENVRGASKLLYSPLMLCGSQFGLKVYRHRYFESNNLLLGLHHAKHEDQTPPAGKGISPKGFVSVGGNSAPIAYEREAMGIDWKMPRSGLREAIPPAFTKFIGEQLVRCV